MESLCYSAKGSDDAYNVSVSLSSGLLVGFSGIGLGCLSCPWLMVLISILKDSIFSAWRDFNSADLCRRKGFLGGALLDFRGSMQLLDSSHVRNRDKALLRAILSGGVWNGFLLGKVRREDVPCRFCGGPDGDGHLLWECSYLPLVAIIANLDKAVWPRCLLWHGWLPALSGADDGDPWAVDVADVASKRLEVALGSYVDAPDVWSDGSLVSDASSGIGIAGCGDYAHVSGAAWVTWICFLHCLMVLVRFVDYIVPFLCSGLRFGEFWLPCMVNHVSRILAGRCTSKPFSLVTDGDLLLRVQQLVRWRVIDNAAVSKVKGHADEVL